MKILSLEECEPIMEPLLKGVVSDGLLKPLHEFVQNNAGPIKSAINSLYTGLTEGKSFQDSIHGMSPKFHPSIETLLIIGIENSRLDHVLSDVDDIYKNNENTLYDKMSLLVDKYQNNPSTKMICEGCFEREFKKILRRAKLEKAYEVILIQEDEKFFHQKYLASKLIHIIEASHSKTYVTILSKLQQSVIEKRALPISGDPINVKEIESDRFVLLGDPNLVLTFK
ncbi:MAG: hypothetical protein HQ510_01235 [Candidatus Marinimicrobia bacterium]|nr:hypothetical protein [Candidatus Neomarinimicrobiota bacterium]